MIVYGSLGACDFFKMSVSTAETSKGNILNFNFFFLKKSKSLSLKAFPSLLKVWDTFISGLLVTNQLPLILKNDMYNPDFIRHLQI